MPFYIMVEQVEMRVFFTDYYVIFSFGDQCLIVLPCILFLLPYKYLGINISFIGMVIG